VARQLVQSASVVSCTAHTKGTALRRREVASTWLGMIAQGSMSSFAKQREAAVSMVLLPQASGHGGAGVLRQAVTRWTKRWVRRRSPRSASAHSVTAQLAASGRLRSVDALMHSLHLAVDRELKSLAYPKRVLMCHGELSVFTE